LGALIGFLTGSTPPPTSLIVVNWKAREIHLCTLLSIALTLNCGRRVTAVQDATYGNAASSAQH
jgi:hypothetical protein